MHTGILTIVTITTISVDRRDRTEVCLSDCYDYNCYDHRRVVEIDHKPGLPAPRFSTNREVERLLAEARLLRGLLHKAIFS